jgi:hypothetical protein
MKNFSVRNLVTSAIGVGLILAPLVYSPAIGSIATIKIS